MAFSLAPSCFHGYLTSCSFSTTQFFPPSLSCGGVSASPVSKLRTCVKFDKFQGDAPLEQTTSASASQEVPLEAEEEEEDDELSEISRHLCYKNWVFLCFREGKASNSIQSLSLSTVSLVILCVYYNNKGTYGLKMLWLLDLLFFVKEKGRVRFEVGHFPQFL